MDFGAKAICYLMLSFQGYKEEPSKTYSHRLEVEIS